MSVKELTEMLPSFVAIEYAYRMSGSIIRAKTAKERKALRQMTVYMVIPMSDCKVRILVY